MVSFIYDYYNDDPKKWSDYSDYYAVYGEHIKTKHNRTYQNHVKGSYLQFKKEGYYLFVNSPMVSQLFTVTADGIIRKEEVRYKYNSVILHVVKDK